MQKAYNAVGQSSISISHFWYCYHTQKPLIIIKPHSDNVVIFLKKFYFKKYTGKHGFYFYSSIFIHSFLVLFILFREPCIIFLFLDIMFLIVIIMKVFYLKYLVHLHSSIQSWSLHIKLFLIVLFLGGVYVFLLSYRYHSVFQCPLVSEKN